MGSLPSRRANWTVKVKIEGQTFFLCVEEFSDGRPGGVFLDAAKHGTFTRGMCDALARMISVALQSDTSLERVVHALRGLTFPPSGDAVGSDVGEVSSVPDWIARELEMVYGHLLPAKPSRAGGVKLVSSGLL